MEKKQYSFFDPQNPMFLSVARWIVIITSGFALLIGIIALGNETPNSFALILGSVLYYFTGMIFVNMLFNIRDIRVNTQKTNELLEKQMHINKNEAE
ncbi:hypothetical protein [Mariniplasma anaerobium]|uniref:DUF4282 domain-containing protein n=1 Tax=Mariniplasma anaerobium TaxID=2735436 RepID=A0A7U9TGF5_9MOLU|nr:hypothetical protein [Mariniplasma anaerobium]BCR35606.1 hypothetical protein MPAN_004990 [Mariniplasma anaerobium]